MYKPLLLFSSALFLLLVACQPPLKTVPRKVKTGLDTLSYTAVLEQEDFARLPGNFAMRHLAGIRIKDRGWSRDCEYPEVVERARNKAMKLGGNVMVITRHELPDQTGSSCSRISAEVYLAPSLEGLERSIRWDPSRPLLPGDLRGTPKNGATDLPTVKCALKYRLLGDFFNEITFRTQATFLSDETWASGANLGKSQLLRRAQLHFNLAELSARRFKNELAALAPNLSAITGRAKPLMAEQEAAWQQRAAEFDAAWRGSNYSEAVLAQWEAKISAELGELVARSGDVTVSLLKRDYIKNE